MKKTILIFSITGFVLSMVIIFAVFRMSFNRNTGMDVSNHALKPFITMPFSANSGQWPEYVLFGAKTSHGMFFLTRNGEMLYTSILRKEEAVIYSEKIEGFNPINVKPADTAVTKISYFDTHARNLTRGICYHTLKAGEVCRGISMELKIRNGLVEKYIYVTPGADLSEFVVETSCNHLKRTDKGEILAFSSEIGFVSTQPLAWQNTANGRKTVNIEYQVYSNCYSFRCGPYSKSDTLFIDPVILSTYLGGSYHDAALKTIQLPDGSIVVAGTTCSPDMPIVSGAYDSVFYSPAGTKKGVYVARLSQNLGNLLYGTFIEAQSVPGAELFDFIHTDTCIYIIGKTSAGFPVTANAYDTISSFIQCFVTCLNLNLSSIYYSTYIGAENSWGGYISFESDKIYITGYVCGSQFPVTANAYDLTYNGGGDVFISVLNKSLSELIFSTFFGGNGADQPLSISIINSQLIISGSTTSTNLHFLASVQDTGFYSPDTHYNFLAFFDTSLSLLNGCCYLGKAYCDNIFGWGTDIDTMNQQIYIGGICSNTIITDVAGAFQNPFADRCNQGFIARFSQQWQLLNFTFVPARITDICCVNNKVYFTGMNFDSTFSVTTGGLLLTPVLQSTDIVAGRFSADLMNYERSARFGGSQFERAENIASCQSGVIICGYTLSDNFPVTPGVIGPQFIPGMHLDQGDMFITILDSNLTDNIRAIYASCGANGHVEPNGIIELTDTSTITFYFFPDSGYRVKAVIADDVNVGSPMQYTFNQVFEDHFLRVEFDSATLVRFIQNKTEPYCFPNPASQNSRFIFSFIPDCKQLNIYNLSGNRIAILEGTPVNNEIHFQWDCCKVEPGIYIAVYNCHSREEYIKFMVK